VTLELRPSTLDDRHDPAFAREPSLSFPFFHFRFFIFIFISAYHSQSEMPQDAEIQYDGKTSYLNFEPMHRRFCISVQLQLLCHTKIQRKEFRNGLERVDVDGAHIRAYSSYLHFRVSRSERNGQCAHNSDTPSPLGLWLTQSYVKR
jgi:hypothetical protein